MSESVEVLEIRGDGLVLSRIVARKYRRYLPHFIERIYDINPKLAAYGPILPVGIKIKFPQPLPSEEASAVEVVKLWN